MEVERFKHRQRPPHRIAAPCFTRRRKECRGPTRLLVSLLVKGLGEELASAR
jgi:hypothetical protein